MTTKMYHKSLRFNIVMRVASKAPIAVLVKCYRLLLYYLFHLTKLKLHTNNIMQNNVMRDKYDILIFILLPSSTILNYYNIEHLLPSQQVRIIVLIIASDSAPGTYKIRKSIVDYLQCHTERTLYTTHQRNHQSPFQSSESEI